MRKVQPQIALLEAAAGPRGAGGDSRREAPAGSGYAVRDPAALGFAFEVGRWRVESAKGGQRWKLKVGGPPVWCGCANMWRELEGPS